VRGSTVIGLGLIGGSVALALNARGWDRSEGVREKARRRGIDVAASLEDALAGAELVVVAVPTRETNDVLAYAAALAPEALLTDVASLKMPARDAAATLPETARYVGGHPMASGAVGGIEGARPDLFRGRPWLLVPTPRSDAGAVETLERRIRELGAEPMIVDAERHDRAMTWISHLPLAVAAALARVVYREAGSDAAHFAGPGLLDTTRLAETPRNLAVELCFADPARLAAAVEDVSRELADLAALLKGEHRAGFESFLHDAAQARADIAARKTPPPADPGDPGDPAGPVRPAVRRPAP
jgi:prephenate dehydrogenase